MKKLIVIAMLLSLGTIQAGSVGSVPASVVTTAIDDTKVPVRLSALPKDAQQYIKENYPVRQITEVSKIKTDNSAVKYEVEVKIEGNIQVVQFDKKGELVNELQK